jgi:predicted enzyme related to lactoylglutathione lyase
MDYWIIQTVPTDEKGMLLKPGVNGGMYKKTEKSQFPVNYVNIENIDTSIKNIKKMGGKVVMDKQILKGVGIFALCLDPEGNPFGLIQPEM